MKEAAQSRALEPRRRQENSPRPATANAKEDGRRAGGSRGIQGIWDQLSRQRKEENSKKVRRGDGLGRMRRKELKRE